MDKSVLCLSDETISKLVETLSDATQEMKESLGERECLEDDAYVATFSLSLLVGREYMRRHREKYLREHPTDIYAD